MLTASAWLRTEKSVVACSLPAAHQARHLLGGHILDVAFAAADRVHFALVGVDADHVKAGFGKHDCQRQPHVAQTKYGDLRRTVR